MKKRIVFILWLTLCTAAFVFFCVDLISSLSTAVSQLSEYCVPNATEIFGVDDKTLAWLIDVQKNGIIKSSLYLVFTVVLYASFAVPTLLKTVKLFRKNQSL